MTTQVANQAAARARRPVASAGVPILAAKIMVPGVPDWAVPRPRITKLIAQGTRWCPLTVVTGPPGAGKTMALASWAAAEPGPVAWMCLDEFDNLPGVFWAYVVAALRRAGVAAPAAPPAARGQEAGHVFLLRLAAALAAQDPPVRLVLDDLHLLTEPAALDPLEFVLRNTRPGLRLVVSSRMDPLLPVHRYRLAGELTEIRASDLAFSTAEAGLLMAQHGRTLPADSLERLTARTEGWAAGLRLAAISMGAHPDPGQFVEELVTEDSALTGYLVEEVLNAQPPAARDLLLATSILDQVSAEAAAALAGNEQAWRILPAVAHANAFVRPLGGGWYRYHTLLAEVLRLKLRHEYPDRPLCTGGPPGGMSGTACSPTRYGTPRRPATGSSPPVSSSTPWPSARSSSRGAPSPWPASSGTCRTARSGPGRSRIWCSPRPSCPLAGVKLPPPRWGSRKASSTVFPPTRRPRRPRAGWPPR
jgi:LuxR family maltose regulon positive regulatory protein